MVEIAKRRIRERAEAAGSVELDLGDDTAPTAAARLTLQHAYSRFVYDALVGIYQRLGFDQAVTDRVIRDLVVARVIEPASKLDTIRIHTYCDITPKCCQLLPPPASA